MAALMVGVGPVAAESDAGGASVSRLGVGGLVSRPRIFERLGTARVSVVSASAGSGKTVLLRSWIGQADLAGSAGWVPVRRGEGDPQPFWLSMLAGLRQTGAGSRLVQPLTAAPDLDGWAIVERLLADLAPLAEPVWLVLDDVHALGPEAGQQLELLIMRAPAPLRFVLAARHDVKLGLHRLRLEGELAEIRGPDLRFTVAEAEELFAASGIDRPTVELLVQRTEGWAAGLRLAALSLAGHPEPARFAEQFSGTERTVAEYLLAEVLERQPEPVRRLLLRTSILDSVNGELADLLTGASGSEAVLQDLEAANAFVVALDTTRSWFRYHHLFADLLQMELRRKEPAELAGLHRQAADWFAAHGYPVEAIRQTQAAQDWAPAARLLADHWPGLHLDGQAALIHQVLAGFPATLLHADAEFAAVAAADQLARGSLDTAEEYLGLAEKRSDSVPEARRGQARLLLGLVRLLLAGQRGNLAGVAEEVERLVATTEDTGAVRPGLYEDLRALALVSYGSAEFWAAGKDAGQHLQAGLTLARRIHRPYLEFIGLAHQSADCFYESFERSAETAKAAVELGRLNGWSNDSAFGVACMSVGGVLVWQGQPEEAEPWVQRAERTFRAETHPVLGQNIRTLRGVLELAHGRDADALAAFQAAERLAGLLDGPNLPITAMRALQVQTLVRLGETDRAGKVLVGLTEQDRNVTGIRIATAALRLAQDDPKAALAELNQVVTPPVPIDWRITLSLAHTLEAIAKQALGEQTAADSALERALELAEPDGALLWFLLHPAPSLLERHARQPTAHAALIASILSLLSGNQPSPPGRPQPLLEALSASELRVLRYLPTNLTGPEIANELYVSLNTIRTHMRHLYEKLGTHKRADTVARARALGLLAPSPHQRRITDPG